MAGTPRPDSIPDVAGASILIVEARYHARINDMLLEGARGLLERARCRQRTLTVPGALEIPAAIAFARDAGFAGFVALGCVIRGETTHYDLVAGDSCRGLVRLGMEGLAVGNGILTVENEAQAEERADPARQDKGGHAALAALALVRWRVDLRGSLL
ncbi:MAG: 6,7-dimethyl-8-ribityllumazine synthase [Geminicoccaceae bacterium]|nr:6,7-dimethyl-8-ribityllumazine synthase [Geminicoccaceae bacterium]